MAQGNHRVCQLREHAQKPVRHQPTHVEKSKPNRTRVARKDENRPRQTLKPKRNADAAEADKRRML